MLQTGVLSGIQAVVFDLDGTLFDHDASILVALHALLANLEESPFSARLSLVAAEWRRLEELHFDAYLAGECSLVEERRRRVGEFHRFLGLENPSSAQATDRWFEEYYRQYRHAWRAYDDVAPAWRQLEQLVPEKLSIGVLSNGDGAQQREKVGRIGLAELVPNTFVSGDIGVAKPDPRAFGHVCREMGVDARHVMYIGDRLDIDARAACHAGMAGVWLRRTGSGGDAGLDVQVITSLVELPALLRSRLSQ